MTAQRIKSRVFALFAVMVAFVSCAVTATPALAANIPATGGTTTFDKYLVMDANASVPPVTFSYSISGASSGQLENGIYSGIGTPSINSVTFEPSYTAEFGKPDDPDATEFKYATKQVTVDFNGISFDAPGVYRYVIIEKSSTNPSVPLDEAITRYLDVLVTYQDDTSNQLKIDSYSMHKVGESTKTASFTSVLSTFDLTLTKTVEGNQGDREKYFKFTVSISGAVEDTVYTVDLDDADAKPTVDGSVETNPTSLKVPTGGMVTATSYLKHEQSIVIQGLTSDTNYTITEENYSTDGYITSFVLDSNPSEEALTTGAEAMGAADHTVIFTNSKSGTVPTGILLETTPYLVMGGVVIVGLVALVATRRRRAQ